jgi:hypothetical protein
MAQYGHSVLYRNHADIIWTTMCQAIYSLLHLTQGSNRRSPYNPYNPAHVYMVIEYLKTSTERP